MNLDLNGKTAFITGGSDGIGKATATILASEGCKVAICARGLEKLKNTQKEILEKTGNKVEIFPTDVRKESDVKETIQKVISIFGSINILINNAGTSHANSFENTGNEIWEEDFSLKIYGAIYTSRAIIPQMKKEKGGVIINLTTPGGKAFSANKIPTAVSRSAGIALTKSMSKELASYNIRVNTVCVGLIKSGQHKTKWEKSRNDGNNISLDEFYKNMSTDIPMGRVGEAEEVGSLIAFLCSDKVEYITGASINIDGGTSPVV